MNPSIRITEEMKQELEGLKQDDETFEELLERLVVTPTPEDGAAMAGFADADSEEQMRATQEELSDSLEANNDR